MDIKSPEEIAISVSPIPFLRLVDGQTVFSRRATRFATLSKEQDFLTFLSAVATAQQAVLTTIMPTFTRPCQPQPGQELDLPLLSIHHWPRQALWLEIFTSIVKQLRVLELPPVVNLDTFSIPAAEELEKQADALLLGEYSGVDAKLTPLLAAALQVYWVAMANALGESAFVRTATPLLCPVCGMPPVASIVRISGATKGLRYLCCPLCASEWHLVRLRCAHCDSTQDISYHELDGSNGAVKAAVCDNCHTYIKIFYLNKEPAMEPIADDLATLVLDILIQESGKNRFAPNLYFHPGNI